MKQKTDRIIDEIKKLSAQKEHILIAIDGRCGSGKTTLAAELEKRLECNVVHTDDFFLRPEQRTEKRLNTPGGNTDHERLLTEVIIPLSENRHFSYRPYICSSQTLGEPVGIVPCRITIIEGSYSCHPVLWDYYDLHIFMDADEKTQLQRIIAREGADAAEIFKSRWIPLEEAYFKEYSIKERCEINIKSEV